MLSVYDMSDFLHLCMLAVNGTNGEFFKVSMQIHMKYVKYLIFHKILVWVIFLIRKCIPRATCMLIIWENFGTKLF